MSQRRLEAAATAVEIDAGQGLACEVGRGQRLREVRDRAAVALVQACGDVVLQQLARPAVLDRLACVPLADLTAVVAVEQTSNVTSR